MSILPPTVIQALQEAELIQKHDRVSIANHKNTPRAVLEKLSQLKASSKIRRAAQARLISIYRELAANPETSTEQLWEMLYHRDIEIGSPALLVISIVYLND